MSTKITDKQKTFCKEFMIDLNGTQAAIRTGYSEKTANEQASRLLANVNIQGYLQKLKDKRSNKLEITAEGILKELYNWAYGDFTELMELSMQEIKELPVEIRRLITGFERVITSGDNPSEKLKVTFVDKKAAMDMINKHISFYAPEKKEVKMESEIPLFPDIKPRDNK